ncbi:tRNA synthetases class I, catalytic domain-containing protein [Aspergillus leporis]|uniref:tRNA synthetases class I, catalytic domain-containing protein n=1 Tax=Aspergillus leporis TaxID=41062 RepID=A0A5N5WZX6_9EURO|nr:tRNA synthetases class I, catalytic domain-containing protein [Aspergillus leporis]
MNEAATENLAKLQLDPETGEMVYKSELKTRFPPEPNSYFHLGHAKAIAINFGFAQYYGGRSIFLFDDTNPDAEEKYFGAIEDIVR